jgi:hypothetical protein
LRGGSWGVVGGGARFLRGNEEREAALALKKPALALSKAALALHKLALALKNRALALSNTALALHNRALLRSIGALPGRKPALGDR